MKLTALKVLVAAIEAGSLRAAGARLGLSQPAVTKIVRELEVSLESPLLVRTSRGVVPTAHGKLLHEHAVKVLRELGAATDGIRQLNGQMVGDLSIAAVPLAVMLLVPEAVRTFGQEFPEIRLRVSEELYMAQLQRLRVGEVDLAIGGFPSGLAPGEFVAEPLVSTTMVVVVRRGSALAQARSLADLAGSRWVYTGSTASAPATESGYARVLFENHGLPAPAAGAVVNSTLALLSIVANSDCVGLLPLQIARLPAVQQHLQTVEVREGGLPLEIGAILRSGSRPSPPIRHFLAHLHRAAAQIR